MSIAVETAIIYKNITDVVIYKEKRPKMGFFEGLRHIIHMKKDAVLLTILTENAITISSTALPILCQLCYLAYPSIYWSLTAGFLIGCIQL